MEFNDGNQWHFVTDPDAYVSCRRMYEMRTCSAEPSRGYRLTPDQQFRSQRALLQSRLDAYLHYQFPYQRAGSPEQQADFFCDLLGQLRPNEMVMLDIEGESGIADPVDFVRRWCHRTESRLDTLAWIYVPNALSGILTRAVTGNRIIKAPRYSGHAGKGQSPGWPCEVWQFTDRGWFPGSAHGPGDCNTTEFTVAQLLGRCRGAVASESDRPVLRLGDRGPAVRRLQQLLTSQ